ncbi:MAG: hypothetical protein WCK77_23435 [Verrucomicrobiota bacterium]
MSESGISGSGATRRAGWLGWALLVLLLAFPSSGFVQKYTGLAGVAAYVGLVAVVLLVIRRFAAGMAPFLRRRFRLLSGVVLAGLVIGFAIVYPIENRGGLGKSSDRDDGLNLAVTRLAEGRTPYYGSNKRAGPLSVLPGGIALAAPFVALGNSAYQNLFWLAAFLLAACWIFGDPALALVLLTVPLALSPAALYEFISGGDMLANGIYVAVFFLLAIQSWSVPKDGGAARWLVCVLLGLGLASRPNFLLLTPLFGAVLWQLAGLRLALGAVSVVVGTAAAITVPFYLHDPAGFTPLLARQKLGVIDEVIPWAGIAMVATTGLLGLVGAWSLLRSTVGDVMQRFFRWCALVTLWPMVCAVGVSSLASGQLDFGFMRDRFGLMYVFFALFGWGGCSLGGGWSQRLGGGKEHGS